MHDVCTGTISRFSIRSVRLINGTAPSEGRVEIWYSNQWYTVCDDYWDITDATVVCRQLGYRGAAAAHPSAHFGQGTGGILLDNLECTGSEGSLFQCPHNGIYSHNCRHYEDASVTCECMRILHDLDLAFPLRNMLHQCNIYMCHCYSVSMHCTSPPY